MFVHGMVKTSFIELSKQYILPRDHRLEKKRRKEERFLFLIPKNESKEEYSL